MVNYKILEPKKGEVYKLDTKNSKGQTIVIDEVIDRTVSYTYVETGLRGEACIDKPFFGESTKITTVNDDVLNCTKDFFICFVEGSNYPVKVKYHSISQAQKAAEHLITNRGVESVHIMKHIGTAKRPSMVSFDFTESFKPQLEAPKEE